PKKAAPIEQRTCLIFRCGPMIHVNRRPEKGLLAGLFEFDWAVENGEQIAATERIQAAQVATRFDAAQVRILGTKRHVFSHLIWQMTAHLIDLESIEHGPDGGLWVDVQTLQSLPFPTALVDWRNLVVVELQGA
ncbi:MAG: NUDIX domain-containing protein, partial [Eubacteriales bacterium]|nr:NUDIX domain-containing protein [Eubacteriales bacterium]